MKETKLRVADLDFDSIKSGLIEYLKTKETFTDYNFEASGLSTIIDVLAYNTHYQSLMANFLANEMFIDTAVKRSSIVSHAKALGYNPKSILASKASINVTITDIYGAPASWSIPAGTRFLTSINNQQYIFSTIKAYSANKNSDNQYVFNDVEIYEGIYVTNILDWNGVDPTISIPNINCDLSTMRVWVFGDNFQYEEYNKATNLLTVDGTSKIYFTQEGFNGNEIYFGDGVLGYKPNATVSSPTKVKISYINTHGAEGNNALVFTLHSSLGSETTNSTIVLNTNYQSVGGANFESSSAVKLNALNHYSSQNRAVIADDFKTLITQAGINTKAVLVWGGEDNNPPKYGTIVICVEPTVGDSLTQSDKDQIINVLQSKAVLNTNFEFVNPDYIDLIVDCRTKYDITMVNGTIFDLESKIKNTIIQYASDNLVSFSSSFRKSNLSSKIDLSDDAILSNMLYVKLLRNVVVGYVATDVSVSFNNILSTTSINPTITSNKFVVSDITQQVWIEDDRNGVLNYVATVNGEKQIVKSSVGTINYNSGELYLNKAQYTWIDGQYLSLIAQPDSDDIYSKKNSIIRLTTDNILVTAISD